MSDIFTLEDNAAMIREVARITNRAEEDYLNSKSGQKELADCMIRAVKTYIAWLEKQQVDIDKENKKSDKNKPKDVSAFLKMVEGKEKAITR